MFESSCQQVAFESTSDLCEQKSLVTSEFHPTSRTSEIWVDA